MIKDLKALSQRNQNQFAYFSSKFDRPREKLCRLSLAATGLFISKNFKSSVSGLQIFVRLDLPLAETFAERYNWNIKIVTVFFARGNSL